LSPDYRLIRNQTNRFLQDRESMKTKTYSGMGSAFQAQDIFATTSQGAIQNRTEEHLVSSDKVILAARKLLEKAIRDVQEGREPPHIIRDSSKNRFLHLLVVSDMISHSSDWKEYTKNLEAEARAKL
jgi:phthalate 4,5-dioxygenase oxygenase subunit